ncbi:MAG: hypothetical protein KGZ58_10940 [Ignavibacteriales bacterium]|nr:hypothetical protein [Ignavibacteriales bacterium]
MKISGFSFVRNGVKFDYPFRESILSLLPIVDEFVIAVGKSEDDTLEQIRAIDSDKIKIIETVWDDALRDGGKILAQQTNIALDAITGDWGFYVQADEILHEKDLPIIVQACEENIKTKNVEGLLLSYKHFYGSYDYVGNSRRWYRREIRIVRNNIGVRSWGDAQGFRIAERKLRVKSIDAEIYHYGWVKSPFHQQQKQKSFNKLWHSDEWVKQRVGEAEKFDYSDSGKLLPFTGTHPAVMKERVADQNWKFQYNLSDVHETTKEKFLNFVEEKTGKRIGEYRNYIEV